MAELHSGKWIWATLVDFGMRVWVISAQIRQMCPLSVPQKGSNFEHPRDGGGLLYFESAGKCLCASFPGKMKKRDHVHMHYRVIEESARAHAKGVVLSKSRVSAF